LIASSLILNESMSHKICRLVKLTLLLFALFSFCCVARAQTPFVTDDADVTEKGKFHFEFINEFDILQRDAFPTLKQNTADFTLAYGLFKNVEISIESPLITLFNARGTEPRRVTGMGDTNLSLKYNFLQEKDGKKRPAMSMSFNLEVPTGSVNKGLGSGLYDFGINGIVQKTLSKKTTLRLNGGIVFSGNQTTGALGIRTRGRVFTGGVSLKRQFGEKLELGAETTGAMSSNFDLGKGQLQFIVGGNYLLNDKLSLDFGVVAGRFAASPRAGIKLGISRFLKSELRDCKL